MIIQMFYNNFNIYASSQKARLRFMQVPSTFVAITMRRHEGRICVNGERTSHTWAARHIPDNRLPTSPSFFFPLFFFNDNAGEWMVARCRYLPSRIRSFDHTGRRMECPSALPRRIRRCGTVHGELLFISLRVRLAVAR